jgi:WD40 repeat protein
MTINGIGGNCTPPLQTVKPGESNQTPCSSWPEGSAQEAVVVLDRVTDLTNESCWTGFAHFPTDLLTHIFAKFSEIGDIFNVCLVNKHWDFACSEASVRSILWRSLFVARFPHIKIQPTTDCKALYKERMEIQRAIKEGGHKLSSFPGHERGMYVSDDLLCLEAKGLITFFDLKANKPSGFKTLEDFHVLLVKNNYLCMVTKEKAVYVWNLKTGKLLELKMVHDSCHLVVGKRLNDITDDNFLCIRDMYNKIKMFDLEHWNPQPLFHYPADEAIHMGTPLQIDSLLGKGEHLYIVDSVREVVNNRPTNHLSYRVSAWEPATGSRLYMACLGQSPPSCITATDDLLLLGSYKGEIAARDRRTRIIKHLWTKKIGSKAAIDDIRVQGALLYAGAEGGEIVICDLMTGKQLYQLCPPIENMGFGRISTRIDVQDDIIITGSVGNTVTVWDNKSRKELGVISLGDHFPGPINDLKIKNNRIYASTTNGKIVVVEFQPQNTSSQGDETPSKK